MFVHKVAFFFFFFLLPSLLPRSQRFCRGREEKRRDFWRADRWKEENTGSDARAAQLSKTTGENTSQPASQNICLGALENQWWQPSEMGAELGTRGAPTPQPRLVAPSLSHFSLVFPPLPPVFPLLTGYLGLSHERSSCPLSGWGHGGTAAPLHGPAKSKLCPRGAAGGSLRTGLLLHRAFHTKALYNQHSAAGLRLGSCLTLRGGGRRRRAAHLPRGCSGGALLLPRAAACQGSSSPLHLGLGKCRRCWWMAGLVQVPFCFAEIPVNPIPWDRLRRGRLLLSRD